MSEDLSSQLDIPASFREEDELKVLENSDDVSKLQSLLEKDEVVYRLVLCHHNDSDGVLAATNKRILFVDKQFIGSLVVEFNYEDIAAVIYNTHITVHQITLAHSAGAITLTHVDRDHGDRFIAFIRDAIGQNYEGIGKNKRALLHHDDMIRIEELYSQGT